MRQVSSVRGLKILAWAFACHLLLVTGHLDAANKNTGTTGAQFLKIGAGARSVGMGEAFTAVADDVNTIAWNPAGLGRLTRPEFTAMHTQWFQDSNYEFVAGAYPTARGTFGIGLASFEVQKIEKRAADTDAPDSTFDSTDALYTLSYGISFGENWAAGLNAKYIRQELDTQSASALASDAGALWRTPHRPLTLGLSIRHIGSEVKFIDEGDPLPLTTTLAASYRLLGDRLVLATDIRQPNDNELQYGVGAEWTQPFFWDLSGGLRAGYNSAGTDPTDKLTGISAGLGLGWRDLWFDAAWVPYGVLGQTFRYAFLIKF